ncbi:MAG: hypothetical protein V1777_01795 [Candidatus Micrarchaeota archaeon]
MDNKVYFTRTKKDEAADEDEIFRFEKSALSDIGRGKDVYIIEQFPRKFFNYAAKIKLEKVIEPVVTLSELSNSRLFHVTSRHSLYE